MTKWKNVSDNFASSLKRKKFGSTAASKYVFVRQLSFLKDKNTPTATDSSIDERFPLIDPSIIIKNSILLFTIKRVLSVTVD